MYNVQCALYVIRLRLIIHLSAYFLLDYRECLTFILKDNSPQLLRCKLYDIVDV